MTMLSDPRLIFDARLPMRDGVELSADIYLPPQPGVYPVILHRTPYDNVSPQCVATAMFFAAHGYVFVSQDVRGRGDSDGKWVPLMNEGPDGYDTIEWIARQPWCSGKIGMMGGSYTGFVQWMAARECPPHLTTIVSTAAIGRLGEEFPYNHGKFGAYNLFWLNLVGGRTLNSPMPGAGGYVINWKRLVEHRPFKDIDKELGRTNTVWRDWLAHNTLDDYWKRISLLGHFAKIDLPILHITGWYDGDQWGELFNLEHLLAQSPAADRQWLICGPWDHAGTRVPRQVLGGINYGIDSVLDTNAVHLRWFDYWLKGIDNGQKDDPKAKLFAMGRNEWRTAPSWPPPGATPTPWYLHSNGNANSLEGDGTLSLRPPGDEPADRYVYDPSDATPSLQNLQTFAGVDTPNDERPIQRRQDVLVFTSVPLAEELEVTGHPFVYVHAASDCVDTDFGATLSDVHPDGRAVSLGNGIVRASYRESRESPTLITPGKVYEYKIEPMATSNVFLPGHRIRVTVESAWFPVADRNPNTGAPVGEDADSQTATQSVYHSQAYPSRIVLPVILKQTRAE